MLNGKVMIQEPLLAVNRIRQLLQEVKDPEIPVLNIEELGVLRDVQYADGKYHILITPTYSGCPAIQAMIDDIKSVLEKNGIQNYSIEMVYSPPWTTDWLSAQAREKLREYGIAPPAHSTAEHLQGLHTGKSRPVSCPFCGSSDTRLTSAFGSTACKALHYCQNCCQPFEEFKCH
jgi:ring-1,2-phenylacetyl-CoA epoxidase subunit PaaD